ncbi:MAG: TonB-dependent receptor, partial [Ectothiorhodospiraceae bacterium]|nr:TonB-dependent receptor [Ectothiorhodospiraceae bacterium]
EQVLVLVDGLPISASTGSTVDVSQLALTEVERIEIVKGATSAQYGSAAMGGVINVITRDVRPGFSGEILGDVGSYGRQNPSGRSGDAASRHGRVRVDTGTQQLRLRLAADRRELDGIDPAPDDWGRPGDAVDRQQLDARLEWHPSHRGRFYVQGSRFEEQGDSRYLFSLPGQQGEQGKDEDVRRDRLVAGGRWRWASGAGIQLNAVTEEFTSDTLKRAGGETFDDRRAEMTLDHASLQLDLPPVGPNLIQVGGDLRRETLTQTKDGVSELDAPDVARRSREYYLQNTVFLGDSLELLVGARFQDDSDFGTHTAGKAGISWHAVRTPDSHGTLRLSWGQGYRVPNLKERYYLFDHSQLGYVVVGNPELQPEASDSYQLGWAMGRRDLAWIDINLFHNRIRNLIQVDTADATVGPGGVSEFRYANVDRAITEGVESLAGLQLSPQLVMTFGHTLYTTVENRNTGQPLTRQPRVQMRLGLDWQVTRRLELALRGRYQSSELVSSGRDGVEVDGRSPGWGVVDIKANYELTRRLRLFGGVDNVFDTQRSFDDPMDFGPVAGVFAYMGAAYRFGN